MKNHNAIRPTPKRKKKTMRISSYFRIFGQLAATRREVAGPACYAPQPPPRMAAMAVAALSQAWGAPARAPVIHRDRPGNLRMLRRFN
jgi:hypothetical protein